MEQFSPSGRIYYVCATVGFLVFLFLLFLFSSLLAAFIFPFFISGLVIYLVIILSVYLYCKSIIIEVGEKAISTRRGILNITSMSIPYSQLANFGRKDSFVERLFGLSTFYADSAGTNVIEIIIADIKAKDVEKLLEVMHAKVG